MKDGVFWERPGSVCSSASSEMSDSPVPSPEAPLRVAEADGTQCCWSDRQTSPPGSPWSQPAADVEEQSPRGQLDSSRTSWTASPVTSPYHFPPNPYRRHQQDSLQPARRSSSAGGQLQTTVGAAKSLQSASASSSITPAAQRSLDRALRLGDCDLVSRLLSRGDVANLNCMDSEGWTPLHRAVQAGHLPLARLLVSHGANHHLANRDGFSSIHLAAGYGHLDIVKYLLSI